MPSRTGSQIPAHPDVLNLNKRVRAAGGTMPTASIAAISKFCAWCYANGLRGSSTSNSIVKWLWVPATTNFTGSLECLWYPSTSTVTNTNFVSGDYSLATGFTGGSNKSLNTNYAPATHNSGHNVHFAIYNRTNTTFEDVWGTDENSSQFSITPKWSDNNIYTKFGGGARDSPGSALGLINLSVVSSNLSNTWVKTSKVGILTSNLTYSASSYTRPLFLFGLNVGSGVAGNVSPRSCGGASLGSGMTDTQAQGYATAWQTMMTEISASRAV